MSAPNTRPKRTRRAPTPIYVPDEDTVFPDDKKEANDSDYDYENDSDGMSVVDPEEDKFKGFSAPKDEYDLTDGFVISDSYVSSDDSDYSDWTSEEEESSTGEESSKEEYSGEDDSSDCETVSSEDELKEEENPTTIPSSD